MNHRTRSILLAWLPLLFLACSDSGRPSGASAPDKEATNRIDVDDLSEYIKTLSSDDFEGREPGTRGERLTTDFLADHFRSLGCLPGNTDGTFFQTVPLVGISADPSMKLELTVGGEKRSLRYREDFMAWTKRVTNTTGITYSPLVFVGYGVKAPEFDWDDYKKTDVSGKTLVMLVNDPPVPSPSNPDELDGTMFGGKAMTYYGRWTYKYEIAAELGADACFIIHEAEPAGYPWAVVSGSWAGVQYDLVTDDKNLSRCHVEGWLTLEAARSLFEAAGLNLSDLKQKAARKDFQPVEMDVRASVEVRNTLREVESKNVLARIEGSDPEMKEEYVIYTAHWDHLGRDPEMEGDNIYNGAVDNATGAAGLMEIAEAYLALETPPNRSVLFFSTTAEEQGLLGSKHYSVNPVYPLEKTAAVINMDALNVHGRTRDVTVIGLGNSTLDDVIRGSAERQGRVIIPDASPEKGYFYRSDHFPLAKQGVPALYADGGIDYVGKPDGFGRDVQDKYTKEAYHKPADEFDPN